MRSTRDLMAFVALGITLVLLGVSQPRFFSGENILNVSRQGAFVILFAVAQMLPVVVRGLDLSQGGLIAFVSVVFATLAQSVGTAAAFPLAIAVGITVGLLNGFLAGYSRISPFVATLGTGSILQGAALIFSNGQPIFNVPSDFNALAWSDVSGIPIVVIVAAAVAITMWFVMQRMVLGRFIYAVGSNPRASELAGIPFNRTVLAAYVGSSAITALAAVFLASRISSGNPTLGLNQALQSIAAVVIGGVSLFGGRGSVAGVVLGAVFLAVLANALDLLNVVSYWQQIVIGATIISAVLFDRVRQKSI